MTRFDTQHTQQAENLHDSHHPFKPSNPPHYAEPMFATCIEAHLKVFNQFGLGQFDLELDEDPFTAPFTRFGSQGLSRNLSSFF